LTTRAVAAVVAAALVGVLSGCGGVPHSTPIIPGPGPSKVEVDTPELIALKAKTDVEDCVPGPGGGGLPDITLSCLGGGTSVDLASLRGPMVVSVWFAGCGPCKKEMPALQSFYDDHGDQVPVLGIDFQDQYPGSALETLMKRGVSYPSVADPGGDLLDTDQFAKVRSGLPAMYFLDEKGVISYVELGGLDSEQEIVDLVQQHLKVTL
jgi:thiol-disulfide isomerase/thioredoxin